MAGGREAAKPTEHAATCFPRGGSRLCGRGDTKKPPAGTGRQGAVRMDALREGSVFRSEEGVPGGQQFGLLLKELERGGGDVFFLHHEA